MQRYITGGGSCCPEVTANRCLRACLAIFALSAIAAGDGFAAAAAAADAPSLMTGKRLLWGDTHLHSAYSFDAFVNDNLSADPATAYRFARGLPVTHPYHGARVQLDRPLDFLAVSDHAEFLGVIRHTYLNGPELEGIGLWAQLKAQIATWVLRRYVDQGRGRELFAPALPAPENPREAARVLAANGGIPEGSNANMLPPMDAVERSTWHDIAETADRFNQPGVFTTLIAWEWSATPGGANLHRIVLSDADAERARAFEPFGMDDSPYPEDLWAFLADTEAATGVEFVAVPHNSNLSKGVMFDERTLRGEAMTPEYAATRQRWEPVAEITQIKGDSETHPALSPDDAFADFETYPYYIQRELQPYQPQPGDYLRAALRLGLALESRLGVNPFRLGFIGSTDAHTGLSSADETNFHGKMATDSIPANKQRGFGSSGGTSGWAMSASGLAAVWATDNTREAIIAAIRRREVYASTGPRITLRFFGGVAAGLTDAPAAGELQPALANAVPMGGSLAFSQAAPRFYLEALHDPHSAYLDRLQVVKGWVDENGQSHERVYDVALSDPQRRQADGSVAPIENTVDPSTGRVNNHAGAASLSAVWSDPDFDPQQAAFYYLRALEIPTARHSYFDALALNLTEAQGQPDTIQERAYSSAIWYQPLRKEPDKPTDQSAEVLLSPLKTLETGPQAQSGSRVPSVRVCVPSKRSNSQQGDSYAQSV